MENAPTLGYSTEGGERVGCLVARQVEGGTEVVASLTPRKAWQFLRPGFLYSAFAAAAAAVLQGLGAAWPIPRGFRVLGWLSQGWAGPAALGAVVFLLVAAIGVAQAVPALLVFRRGPRWAASEAGVRCQARTMTRADDVLLARPSIAGLTVAKFVLTGKTYWPRRGAAVLSWSGPKLLYFGTRAECRFLAEQLSRGTGVPLAEEARFRRSWTRAFRIAGGVWLEVPKRGKRRCALAAALATMAAGACIWWQFAPRTPWLEAAGVTLAAAPISALAVAGALKSMLRGTHLRVGRGTFTLVETGLWPASLTAPLAKVESVELGPRDILIRIQNHAEIRILTRRSRAERTWVTNELRDGLARARAERPTKKRDRPGPKTSEP